MKILRKIYNNFIQFILYRIHLKEFKMMWMYNDVNKKQFKQLLSMEKRLMYDKIDHEFKKYFHLIEG